MILVWQSFLPSSLTADILRFLLAHLPDLGPTAHTSLEELGMLTGGPDGAQYWP
jgi:hypothetical protein